MADYEDDPLSLEDLLIHEGIDYRTSSGNKGMQLNIRECQNPHCQNDNWKVYANQETSLGNCFACDEGLNVFKFTRFLLQNRGGMPSNRDVGLYLNDVRRKLGYRPKRKVEVTVAVQDDLRGVALPQSASLPYSDGWMHPYLLSRGIDGSYAAKFHLKYASFGTHVYVNDLGETKSQRFQERIIIPVYDLAGGLVTFQGRDVTGFGERYLFAGGLPGTGRYLYNGHVCAARRSKTAVMGEGAFDVIKTQIALDQYADTQHVTAIGSWGKHLSNFRDGEDQIQALQRLKRHGLEEIVLMWDGEPKAYEAALDAAADILKIGLNVRVAILPAGKDPGELDARIIADAYRNALPATRLTLLRMRMKNPYAPA